MARKSPPPATAEAPPPGRPEAPAGGVPCPFCGHALRSARPAPGVDRAAAPEPGDWTVCARCASPLVVGPDLAPAPPPPGAYAALAASDPAHHGAIERLRRMLREANGLARR